MPLEVSASSLLFSCPEFHIFFGNYIEVNRGGGYSNQILFYDICVMVKINPEF